MIDSKIVNLAKSAIEEIDPEKMRQAVKMMYKIEGDDPDLVKTRYWMSWWIRDLNELRNTERLIFNKSNQINKERV